MIHNKITELFDILADGNLDKEDIAAMSAEVEKAHANPEDYLSKDVNSVYNNEFPMSLWEWVMLEQLEDGLLFRSDKVDALYGKITDAFSEGELDLKVDELIGVEDQKALRLVQEELDPVYVMVNFSKSINDEMQVVLLRNDKLERFQDICNDLGVQAEPVRSRPDFSAD